jgi:hypothetical protein
LPVDDVEQSLATLLTEFSPKFGHPDGRNNLKAA